MIKNHLKVDLYSKITQIKQKVNHARNNNTKTNERCDTSTSES
jgi:hypothetical protein